MNFDIQILSFIENNAPIRRNDVKTLLLWLSNDEDLHFLTQKIEPEYVDSVIERLINEKYVEEKFEFLYVNEEKFKMIHNFVSKTMTQEKRNYSLELLWIGQISLKYRMRDLEELEKLISDYLRSNQCISLFNSDISKPVEKLSFQMRYFKTELSLTIRRTNFIINSKAAIPDIPLMEGTDKLIYPLTEIPRERELFSIIAAPNIAANFFILKTLETVIKKIDPTAQLIISLPEFRIARGEDPFDG